MFNFYGGDNHIDIGSNPLTEQKFYFESSEDIKDFSCVPHYAAFSFNEDEKGKYVYFIVTSSNISNLPLNQDISIKILCKGKEVGSISTIFEWANGIPTNKFATVPNKCFLGTIVNWRLRLLVGSNDITMINGSPTVIAYTKSGAHTIPASISNAGVTANIQPEIDNEPVTLVSLTLPYSSVGRENCTYYIQPDHYNVDVLKNSTGGNLNGTAT